MREVPNAFPRSMSCGCRSLVLLVEFFQSLIFVRPTLCESSYNCDFGLTPWLLGTCQNLAPIRRNGLTCLYKNRDS